MPVDEFPPRLGSVRVARTDESGTAMSPRTNRRTCLQVLSIQNPISLRCFSLRTCTLLPTCHLDSTKIRTRSYDELATEFTAVPDDSAALEMGITSGYRFEGNPDNFVDELRLCEC